MPVLPGNYVRNALAGRAETYRLLQDQKEQAIRWQGARDYETLVGSGVEPRDALRRTAPKLFYNDPRALAATVPSMLSQPGGLVTDPQTGRTFTVDRFGNYKPVSEQQLGWRRAVDPNTGQSYTVRVQPGEQVPTGQLGTRQPPPVWAAPGGGRFALMPGGNIRSLPRDPVLAAGAKDTLENARTAAAPILSRWRKASAQNAAGQRRWGPDWNPLAVPYTNQMAQAEEELRQLGFDTEGRVLPGSRLQEEVYGGQVPAAPSPAVGGLPAQPAAPALPPPVAAPVPAAPPPPRPQIQRRQLPGGGFMLRGPQAAPPAARSRPRQLGPDQVIKYTRDGRAVLVNTRTGERMWYGR